MAEKKEENAAPAGSAAWRRKRGSGGGDGAEEEYEEDANGDENMATPRRKRARTGGPAADVVETPTKTPVERGGSARKEGSGFVGRIKKAQQKTSQASGVNKEAPAFVMPVIRRLAKVYDTSAMAPHVYTGVCVVLKEAGLWPPDADEERREGDGEGDEEEEALEPNVLALTAALYLMVLTKMGKGQMKTKVFHGVSKKAVELFWSKGLRREEAISDWIKRINENGWCKGQEWFESVPNNVFVFQLAAAADGIDEDDDDDDDQDGEGDKLDDEDERQMGLVHGFGIDLDKDDPEGVLLPGLGTMMQPSVDWVSEERRRKFTSWRKAIMLQVEGVR